MTVEEVLEIIKRHRNQHLHTPVGGDAGDPAHWSEGGFQRAMVQEYDALRAEIQHEEAHAGSR